MWATATDLLRTRPVRSILVVVVVVAVYQVWITVQAGGKVADDVGSDPGPNGRFEIDVHLGFPPERFHILKLQDHGRITGTDGDVVHLRSVSPAGVDAVARWYWIDKITAGENS